MHISAYETTEGLERRLSIDVAAADIDGKVTEKLNKLAKTAKLDGFRPGKIPMRVIKQQYEEAVRAEIVQQSVNDALTKAFSEKAIRAAGQPNVEILHDTAGEDLKFNAVFEIYPDVPAFDVSGLSVEHIELSVQDSDVDEVILRWRRGRAKWDAIESAASDGDRLTIDYTCKVNGETVAEACGEQAKVVLGAGVMMPGFEEGLIGHKAGDTVELTLDMPTTHKQQQLAGQQALLSVHILKTERPDLPEVDEAFCQDHGVTEGGVPVLREQIRASLEKEGEKRVRDRVKQQIFMQLLERNDVTLPRSMVDAEKQLLLQQQQPAVGTDNAPPASLSPEQDQALNEQAERSVTLGILIGAYVSKHNIKPDQQKVQQSMKQMSLMYQEPEKAITAIAQNQAIMSRIVASVLEEQAVEVMLGELTIEKKSLSFKELLATA